MATAARSRASMANWTGPAKRMRGSISAVTEAVFTQLVAEDGQNDVFMFFVRGGVLLTPLSFHYEE